jgi:hypothetical protein
LLLDSCAIRFAVMRTAPRLPGIIGARGVGFEPGTQARSLGNSLSLPPRPAGSPVASPSCC